MSRYDEVLRISKKLEKIIANKDTDAHSGLDLLKALKKQPMTLEVLEKTHIGMLVNQYRRSSKDDETVSLAKSLIKSWKKLLPADKGSSSSSSSSVRKSASSASLSNSCRDDGDSRDSQNVDMAAAGGSSSETSSPHHPGGDDDSREGDGKSQGGFGNVNRTNDPVRIRCRQMLADALKSGAPVDGGFEPGMLAASIEDHIYNEFKNTDMKYKNRIRSRITNLKDAKNPRLRENVLLGGITAHKLAIMTSEEMASDEMKSLRAQLTKQAIDEHQMGVQGGTKSDLFKCSRCGQRDTTYNQVQTRSADEPMTTFVLCNNCGLRWKFC